MNSDSFITASELHLFLSERVSIDSENQHTPQFGRMTSQEGEFVFIIKVDTLIMHDNNTITVNESNIDYSMLAKELTKQLQESDQTSMPKKSIHKEKEKNQEVYLFYIGSPAKYINLFKNTDELKKYFKKSKHAELFTLNESELNDLRSNIESDLLSEFYNQDINYKVTQNEDEITFIKDRTNEIYDNYILAENIFNYYI